MYLQKLNSELSQKIVYYNPNLKYFMNEILKYSLLLVAGTITVSIVVVLLGAPIQVMTGFIHFR